MTFEEYLKAELSKPDSKYYTPDGNSSRAVVKRGRFRETVRQYRYLPDRFRSLNDIDGLNTPIGLFITVPFFLVFFPILPILWGFISYRRAISDYKRYFEDGEK